MALHVDTTNQAGAAICACLVFIKNMVASIFLGTITWNAVYDAVILAAIGAVVGFFVTALLKGISRKLFKSKKS